MLSLFVSQRSQEMAIRLALGASPFDLSRWVLTQSSMLCVIGLAVGFGIFLSLQEYLSTYLIMVASSRLVVYLGVTALILVSCILASLGPALRVLKIEPARALRSE
jgi:ABC-type antimicrobial peptide transport system permease subunit